MSRLFPFVLAVFLIVPVAYAQLPTGGAATLTLSDLPEGTFQTNESLAVIPFKVDLSITNMVCTGGGAVVTVALAATSLAGEAGPQFMFEVTPATMSFNVPTTNGNDYEQTQGASLTVRPVDAIAETTFVSGTLTATITDATGCVAQNPPTAANEVNVDLAFGPTRGADVNPGRELPGPALPLLALAIVALALFTRRLK